MQELSPTRPLHHPRNQGVGQAGKQPTNRHNPLGQKAPDRAQHGALETHGNVTGSPRHGRAGMTPPNPPPCSFENPAGAPSSAWRHFLRHHQSSMRRIARHPSLECDTERRSTAPCRNSQERSGPSARVGAWRPLGNGGWASPAAPPEKGAQHGTARPLGGAGIPGPERGRGEAWRPLRARPRAACGGTGEAGAGRWGCGAMRRGGAAAEVEPARGAEVDAPGRRRPGRPGRRTAAGTVARARRRAAGAGRPGQRPGRRPGGR